MTTPAPPVDQRFAEIVAEVRRAERERIASILGHAEAAGRRTLAEHLAFETTQSVDEAVALMATAGKSQPPELRSVVLIRADGDSIVTHQA